MFYLGCIISEQQKDKRTEASEAMQGNVLQYWLFLLVTPQKNAKYTHSTTQDVICKEPLFRTVYPKEERRESEFTCLFRLSSGSKFALQGGNQTRSLTLTSRLDKLLAASQEVRSNTMCPVTLRCLDVLQRAEIPSLMLEGLGRHTSWAALASLGLGRG